MTQLSDVRSITGRIGALTVIADLRLSGVAKTKFLFEAMKPAYRHTGYAGLSEMYELYALRWSPFRFPGAAKTSLIFETVFYGDWEQYLVKLVRRSSWGIDVHARFLESYPKTNNVDVFLSFLTHNHHPASHVYAAHPMMSPTDIEQLVPQGPTEPPRRTSRWFGFIVALRPNSRTAVQDLVTSYTHVSSPFAVSPQVHHGRIVVISRQGQDYLMVSLVYAETHPPEKGPYRGDREDRFIIEQLLAGPALTQWQTMLAFATDAVPTRADTQRVIFARRFGGERRGPIRWVDGGWGFSPSDMAPFFSMTNPRRQWQPRPAPGPVRR